MGLPVFLIFIFMQLGWAENSPTSEKLPRYCEEASLPTTRSPHPTEAHWLTPSFRGIASTIAPPKNYAPMVEESFGCKTFRQNARTYLAATILYQQKQIKQVFPKIQSLIYPSCPALSPKIKEYIDHLKTVPILSGRERDSYVSKLLSNHLANAAFFESHFLKHKEAQKILENKGSIEAFKKEVAALRRVVPSKCQAGQCSPLEKTWLQRWQASKRILSQMEKKYETAQSAVSTSEPFVFSDPILMEFNSPYLLKAGNFKPSEFSQEILQKVRKATLVSSRNQWDIQNELSKINAEANPQSAHLDQAKNFFAKVVKEKAAHQVAEKELRKAYEKKMAHLNMGLKQICLNTDFQVDQKLAAEMIALAPTHLKRDYQKAHCDCILYWPELGSSNKAQVAMGVVSTGVGLGAAFWGLPALAIGAFALGTGSAGVAAYKAVTSSREADAGKGLHQVGYARAEDVSSAIHREGKNFYGAFVDTALLPVEGLSVLKAVHPKAPFFPSRANYQLGDFGASGLLKKIKLKASTFRMFSYAIKKEQKDLLNFIGGKSPRTARLIAQKIAKHCKDKKCTAEDIDEVLLNSPRLLSFEGLEGTAFGLRLKKLMSEPLRDPSIQPRLLTDKLRFFEESSKIGGQKTVDILQILKPPINHKERSNFLRVIGRMDFEKGLDLEKDPARFSDMVTQLKFFRHYRKPNTAGVKIRQVSRCNELSLNAQSKQCHILEQQIRAALTQQGFQKIGKLKGAFEKISQNPKFRQTLSTILKKTHTERFWKAKNIEPPKVELPQNDLDELVRILSNPALKKELAEKQFQARPGVKAFVAQAGGKDYLELLWSSSHHMILKAAALWGAYEFGPKLFEGGKSMWKSVRENAGGFRGSLKLPSEEKVLRYNCGELTQLSLQLTELEVKNLQDGEVQANTGIQVNSLMESKACFSR